MEFPQFLIKWKTEAFSHNQNSAGYKVWECGAKGGYYETGQKAGLKSQFVPAINDLHLRPIGIVGKLHFTLLSFIFVDWIEFIFINSLKLHVDSLWS